MKISTYLIIFFIILLFALGFVLGYNQNPNATKFQNENNKFIDHNERQIYEERQIGITDQQETKNNIVFGTKTDNETESEKAPDVEYYKKAKVLQNLYPDTFIMNHQTFEKKIALTFDDGPDGKTTPRILDTLKEYNVTATFFVLGKNVKLYPKIVNRMINEGHQVANHSWSHLRPTELSLEEFLLEIDSAEEILQNYINRLEFFYYRPPYGLLTPEQIEEINYKGYKIISWSIDSLDWNVPEPEKIQDKVISSVHPGAIILMHSAGGKDQREGTIKALPGIIENLTKQGYEFVTVHNLINEI
ncbi:MAG: polysaccharide deacetylase family protein [Caldicoprobacterales bacterium]